MDEGLIRGPRGTKKHGKVGSTKVRWNKIQCTACSVMKRRADSRILEVRKNKANQNQESSEHHMTN